MNKDAFSRIGNLISGIPLQFRAIWTENTGHWRNSQNFPKNSKLIPVTIRAKRSNKICCNSWDHENLNDFEQTRTQVIVS